MKITEVIGVQKREVEMDNSFFTKAWISYFKTDNLDGIYKSWMTKDTFPANIWTATPSMLKKETVDADGKELQGQVFTLNNDHKNFMEYYENLISYGRLKTLEGTEVCIGKDVTSRTALGFSGATDTGLIPNIIVIPNPTVPHSALYEWIKNESTLEIEKGMETIEIEKYDGAGLATPKFCDKIKERLGLDYNIDFFAFRLYGIAGKGVCLKFDIEKYIDEFGFGSLIKDAWGNDITLEQIRNCDMLLTKSQAKWLGLYDSLEDFINARNTIEDEWAKTLWITKTNKKKVNDISLTNYQLINNLALTEGDLKEIAQPTEDSLNSVRQGNMDAIKWLLKQVEFDHDEDDVEDVETLYPSQKADMLLEKNAAMFDNYAIQRQIVTLIKKKQKQLQAGKFYIDGANWKCICSDPIDLMNYLLGIDNGHTLKEREFFIPSQEAKNYTIQRCPCSSPQEILNIATTKNEVLERYLDGYTSEIIIMNEVDNTLKILSGADRDGDIVFTIEADKNPIIYRSVVKFDAVFLNRVDGKKASDIYNRENVIKSFLKTRGNLIGKLSFQSAKVSDSCQKGSREDIISNFYNNRKLHYLLLMLEMMVIDAPKTQTMPSKDQIKNLNKHMEKLSRKPNWMIAIDIMKKTYKDKEDYLFTFSTMCKHSQSVFVGARELEKGITTNKTGFRKYLKDGNTENIELNDIVEKMYEEYKEAYKNKKESLIKWKCEDAKLLYRSNVIESANKFLEVAGALYSCKASDVFIMRYFFNTIYNTIPRTEDAYKLVECDNGGVHIVFRDYSKKYNVVVDTGLQQRLVVEKVGELLDDERAVKARLGGITYRLKVGDIVDVVSNDFKGKMQSNIYISNEKVSFSFSLLDDAKYQVMLVEDKEKSQNVILNKIE